LFFGIWPDHRMRRGLVQMAATLRDYRGRPQHPQDLHITLVFIGQVTNEQYPCVLAAAEELQGRPFNLCIDRVGYWKRPGILWCGPSSVPAALTDLVLKLQQGLQLCGFEAEKRTYCPHVTMARKVINAPVLGALAEPLSWPVDDFVLAASHTGADAPRYRVLKKWSLGS